MNSQGGAELWPTHMHWDTGTQTLTSVNPTPSTPIGMQWLYWASLPNRQQYKGLYYVLRWLCEYMYRYAIISSLQLLHNFQFGKASAIIEYIIYGAIYSAIHSQSPTCNILSCFIPGKMLVIYWEWSVTISTRESFPNWLHHLKLAHSLSLGLREEGGELQQMHLCFWGGWVKAHFVLGSLLMKRGRKKIPLLTSEDGRSSVIRTFQLLLTQNYTLRCILFMTRIIFMYCDFKTSLMLLLIYLEVVVGCPSRCVCFKSAILSAKAFHTSSPGADGRTHDPTISPRRLRESYREVRDVGI